MYGKNVVTNMKTSIVLALYVNLACALCANLVSMSDWSRKRNYSYNMGRDIGAKWFLITAVMFGIIQEYGAISILTISYHDIVFIDAVIVASWFYIMKENGLLFRLNSSAYVISNILMMLVIYGNL